MSGAIPSLTERAAALREGAGALRMDDAVLILRGDDRLEWLAGVVTHDVKALAAGDSRYVAIVHEKGKILADGWVHARRDDVLLVVPRSTAPGLLVHFDRHIVMEDVEVVAADTLSVTAVSGASAEARVPPDGVAVFRSDRIGWGGVDVIAPDTHAALASGSVLEVDEAAWDVARLEAGVPRFGIDFDHENYVQEANITERAVSFHKGCYIGQEVVCRLQMRGHVRRQLVSLIVDGDPPARGASVGDVGSITSSAKSDKLGRSVALAMVKWDVAQRGGSIDVGSQRAEIVARPIAR
jgi:folate-binding protein YgfZ